MFEPSRSQLPDGRDLLVRTATPADAEAWIATIDRIAAERVYLMTEKFGRTVDEIRTQFREADPRNVLWLVAEVAGTVVGGADVHRGKWEKTAHTGDLGIFLLPDYRGLGIGRRMMERMIGWARSVGVRKLKLGVFATNERAIALYRGLGFAEEARLHDEAILNGHPVDEVLMVLWL